MIDTTGNRVAKQTALRILLPANLGFFDRVARAAPPQLPSAAASPDFTSEQYVCLYAGTYMIAKPARHG